MPTTQTDTTSLANMPTEVRRQDLVERKRLLQNRIAGVRLELQEFVEIEAEFDRALAKL